MNRFIHTIRYCLVSLSLFLILASLSPLHSSAAEAPEDNSAIIDNGDLLYVVIPKEVTSEFSPTEKNYFKEKVEVDRHGYIFLPSQGNIRISGYTTRKISEILTSNLPKYLSKSDHASVNLIEKRHYIQILGHVASPGWYNIPESANIQAILSQAGGSLEGADLARVTITRKEGNKTRQIHANIQQYLLEGDTAILPRLLENDTVFVPLMVAADDLSGDESMLNTSKIRIFGAVNSPGIYPVPKGKGINLLDLIITAGGETTNADLSEIQIMRADGSKEIFNMQSLFDADTSGSPASFPAIHGGDIIRVPRSEMVSADGTGNLVASPQTITITGPGSNNSGLQSFTSGMTPLQAIAQAGGVNTFADTNDIFIIRRVEGKQKNLPYNYDKALRSEQPDVDFLLKADDIIYIP